MSPPEQKQSYIPLLKVLVCGINAWGAQWLGGNFTLQYIILKMTILLHKTALVNFPMATTVECFHFFFKKVLDISYQISYYSYYFHFHIKWTEDYKIVHKLEITWEAVKQELMDGKPWWIKPVKSLDYPMWNTCLAWFELLFYKLWK